MLSLVLLLLFTTHSKQTFTMPLHQKCSCQGQRQPPHCSIQSLIFSPVRTWPFSSIWHSGSLSLLEKRSSVGFQNTLHRFPFYLACLLSSISFAGSPSPIQPLNIRASKTQVSVSFSVFSHSPRDLIKSPSSKYLLSANDFQILISRLRHSPEFQTQIPNCLLSSPLWYIRLSISKTKFLIFLPYQSQFWQETAQFI